MERGAPECEPWGGNWDSALFQTARDKCDTRRAPPCLTSASWGAHWANFVFDTLCGKCRRRTALLASRAPVHGPESKISFITFNKVVILFTLYVVMEAKVLLHLAQEKGLLPVWRKRCCLYTSDRWNFFPHVLHSYRGSSTCCLLWVDSLLVVLNCFGQYLHWYS